MLIGMDGASSLDTRSDGFEVYFDLSTSPKFGECDSRSLSKASSYLDIDGLLEDSRQQHFLVVEEGLHDPCSPSDLHQLRHFDCGAATTSGRDKELYCLVVVDNETGIPVRAATDSETEEVARLLADYEPYGLTACPPFQPPSYASLQQQQQQQRHQRLRGDDTEQQLQHQHAHSMQHSAQHSMVQQSMVQQSASVCESIDMEQQHSTDESTPQPSHKPPPRPFNHKTESPQWRRGPPAKPVLCNACGTRYRRTNQLGPPQNGGSRSGGSTAKRRLPALEQHHSSSEDLRTKCLKQQRLASLVSCEA